MNDMYWKPIACTLQLNFTGAQKAQQQTSRPCNNGSAAAAGGNNNNNNSTTTLLQAGDGYTGVSVIRYRKEVLPALPSVVAEQDTEHGLFLRRLHANATLHGLHVHAHSRPAHCGPYASLQPLTSLNYKVTLVSSPGPTATDISRHSGSNNSSGDNDADTVHDSAATTYSSIDGSCSSSSMKRGTVLKIVSVIELDKPQRGQSDVTEEDDSDNKRVAQKSKKNGSKPQNNNNARKKQQHSKAGNDDEEKDDAMAEWGGKVVQFAHSALLPRGAEVELSVSFAATVQSDTAGAVYAPRLAAATTGTASSVTSNSSSSAGGRHASSALAATVEEQEGRAALLTHFEVVLARAAFVCPDCPQYRLRWELKALQLPEAYHTVYSNAVCVERKAMPHQRAVQYRFAPCGPLPVYAVAWSAFAGPPLLQAGSTTTTTTTSTSATVDMPAAQDMLVAVAAKEGTSAVTDSARQAQVKQTGSAAMSSESWAACHTRQLPVSVFAMSGRGVTAETLDAVQQLTVRAVTLLQDFFACPLPLLGCSALTVLLVPTMPYISGMEHHCCIALRDTLYSNNNTSSGRRGTSSSSGRLSEAQISLVVHELAHHWVGNALGLPFTIKEGICQVLEQLLSDVLQGKPMRKLHKTSEEPRRAVAEVTKGKEFTGHTYQHAQLAVQNVVCDCGFSVFRQRLRAIVARYLTEPMARQQAVECDGVNEAWEQQHEMSYGMQHVSLHDEGNVMSATDVTTTDDGPYLSTETFLSMLQATPQYSSST